MATMTYTVRVNGILTAREHGQTWDAASAIDWAHKAGARMADGTEIAIWRRPAGSATRQPVQYRRYTVTGGITRRADR